MEAEFISDALADFAADAAEQQAQQLPPAVQYREGTHLVNDPAFCMGVMLRMLKTVTEHAAYRPTEAQARGVRHHMHRAGIALGETR